MMEGVTVLNVIEHTVAIAGWSWIGFIFLVLTCIAITAGILNMDETQGMSIIVALIGGMFLGTVAVAGFMTGGGSQFSHYSYKVTVDDSVSLVEFNKRYEIVDQEGLIYEIIERTSE